VSRAGTWLVVALTLAVILSGVGVVYTKYLSRKHFVQLQTLRAERDRVDIRWRRLQLEESTLASYSRVETDARDRLGMRIPGVGEVEVLRRR
jgi:cell division protein FtsL